MREEELKYLTRDEALNALKELQTISNFGILPRGLIRAISDIMKCIEMEKSGYHIWGAPVHHVVMIKKKQDGDVSNNTRARINAIERNYRFLPASVEIEAEREKTTTA